MAAKKKSGRRAVLKVSRKFYTAKAPKAKRGKFAPASAKRNVTTRKVTIRVNKTRKTANNACRVAKGKQIKIGGSIRKGGSFINCSFKRKQSARFKKVARK